MGDGIQESTGTIKRRQQCVDSAGHREGHIWRTREQPKRRRISPALDSVGKTGKEEQLRTTSRFLLCNCLSIFVNALKDEGVLGHNEDPQLWQERVASPGVEGWIGVQEHLGWAAAYQSRGSFFILRLSLGK